MGNYGALLRIAALSFLAYQLISDPKELGRQISSYTVSTLDPIHKTYTLTI